MASAMARLLGSLQDAVTYLRDPMLVRRIQEAFGMKVIVEEEKDEDCRAEPSLARRGLSERGRGRKDKFENGVLKLATRAIGRQRKRRPVSPPSSPEFGSPERDVPEVTVETCSLIDLYFKLATTMGYEPFYITFLPYLCWNVDMLVARHLIVLWALSMYIGQAAKCLIKWRRPSAPPAVRLEDNPVLEQEYGFPSTHAIVCTTVPFYLLYLLPQRYEVSYTPLRHLLLVCSVAADIVLGDAVYQCWLVADCLYQQGLPGCPQRHGNTPLHRYYIMHPPPPYYRTSLEVW